MNKLKTLIVIVSILFSVLELCAVGDPNIQANYTPNIIPPSPTASELGRYGQIPVGLSTGTPNINIPLYNFKTKNLSLPISLSYNSNGIKVDQLSTWVGMAWSLNAGGVITRTVRDKPDDSYARITPPQNLFEYSAQVWNYFTLISTNPDIDTEPDLFSFNFSGNTGSFVLGDKYTPTLIPHQNLKIETDYLIESPDEIHNIIVTTPNGVKYYFGGGDLYEETSRSITSGAGCGHDFSEPVITSWYLQKIVHPIGDVINFTYAKNNYQYDAGISQTIKMSITPPSSYVDCGPDSYITCNNTMAVKALHLTEISATNYGKIIFSSDLNRPDLNNSESRLTNLSVQNNNSEELKSIEFEHVFSSPNTRMFLDALIINDKTGTEVQAYSFEYEDINALPARLSYSQDHWGFYNGAQNIDFVPNPGNIYNGLFDGIGGDREPNSNFSKKGILTKINYPTGGFNQFVYEPNSYNDDVFVPPPGVESYLETIGIEDFFAQTVSSSDFTISYSQNVFIGGSVIYDDSYYPYLDNKNFGTIEIYDVTESISILSVNLQRDESFFQEVLLEKNHVYRHKVTARGEGNETASTMTYYPGEGNVVNMNVNTGGLRIKKVLTNDLVNNTNETTRYYYTSMNDTTKSTGELNHDPVYYRSQIIEMVSLQGWEIKECQYIFLHSNSQSNLYDFESNFINYKIVTESKGEAFENGGEESTFRLISAEPANSVRGNIISGTTYTNTGWNNGNKLKTKIFKKDSNENLVVIKETAFNYKEDVRRNKMLKGVTARKNYDPVFSNNDTSYCTAEDLDIILRIQCDAVHEHKWFDMHDIPFAFLTGGAEKYNPICIASGWNLNDTIYGPCYGGAVGDTLLPSIHFSNFDVMEYYIYSKWEYINQKTETIYDINGLNPVTTVTNYYYDNEKHLNLTRTEITDSEGDLIKTFSFYPEDYPNSTLFENLIDNHIVNIPIDNRTYINNYLTNGVLTKYNDYGQQLEVLVADNELNTTLPIDTLVSNPYNYGTRRVNIQYDANLNIQTFNLENNIPITFIWGYNETYPIAKIENSTYSEIDLALSFPSFNTSIAAIQALSDLDVDIASEGALRVALDQIRQALPKAMVTTYTYDPLIGITSITDPRGETIYYDYDDFNRLSLIKNSDEDIVQKTNYHYQVVPFLDVTTSVITANPSGSTHNVSVSTNVTDWTVSDNASWLSVVRSSDQAIITAVANDSGSSRSATVTFSGEGLTDYITVNQAYLVPTVSISPTRYTFTSVNQSFFVFVNSNTNWTVTALSLGNWITATPSSGSNNDKILVKCVDFGSFKPGKVNITNTATGEIHTVTVFWE